MPVTFPSASWKQLWRDTDDDIYAYTWERKCPRFLARFFLEAGFFRNKTVSVSKLSESRAIGISGTCSEIKFPATRVNPVLRLMPRFDFIST